MKNTIAKIVQHTKNGQIAYMRMTIICLKGVQRFSGICTHIIADCSLFKLLARRW